jgi:hypothetical protein
MRFGTWNVRNLYKAGSFMAAAREFARYKLDLVGVQVVRWDKVGVVRARGYNFFYGKDGLYEDEEQVFYHLQKALPRDEII